MSQQKRIDDGPSTIAPPSEATIRVEKAIDRLCELVTTHGPKHVVRGMQRYQVYEAIVECLEAQCATIDKVEAICRPWEFAVDNGPADEVLTAIGRNKG